VIQALSSVNPAVYDVLFESLKPYEKEFEGDYEKKLQRQKKSKRDRLRSEVTGTASLRFASLLFSSLLFASLLFASLLFSSLLFSYCILLSIRIRNDVYLSFVPSFSDIQ
jgi:hypothetical protein